MNVDHFNINCKAQLGEILQRHQHANPAFSNNMFCRGSCRLTPIWNII